MAGISEATVLSWGHLAALRVSYPTALTPSKGAPKAQRHAAQNQLARDNAGQKSQITWAVTQLREGASLHGPRGQITTLP